MNKLAIENSDITEIKDKSQNIPKNLYALLKSKELNANQLAQLLGIPMMTIRRLLSGETSDPRVFTLKLIANYFGVTIDSLIEKNPIVTNNSLEKARPFFVPKLNWEIVSKIKSLNDINLSDWKEWQSISLNEKEKVSNNAFALESRPSMFPRFSKGTLFIFDNDVIPRDGDIV